MEVLQAYIIKHKAMPQNQVVDALSRRYTLLSTMRASVVGFEVLKDLYNDDPFFGAIWEGCPRGPSKQFFLQDGFLFKGSCLCITQYSLRDAILMEARNSSHGEHFGQNKTLAITKETFYWPKMERNVMRYVQKCSLYHMAKSHSQNTGSYTPHPVLQTPWQDVTIDFCSGIAKNIAE